MTPAEFKALFPEFSKTPDALVQSRLNWAELRTPLAIWGDKLEQGVGLLAAHFLTLLPQAKDLRKGEQPGATMYMRERARLNKIVSSGFRQAGA